MNSVFKTPFLSAFLVANLILSALTSTPTTLSTPFEAVILNNPDPQYASTRYKGDSLDLPGICKFEQTYSVTFGNMELLFWKNSPALNSNVNPLIYSVTICLDCVTQDFTKTLSPSSSTKSTETFPFASLEPSCSLQYSNACDCSLVPTLVCSLNNTVAPFL